MPRWLMIIIYCLIAPIGLLAAYTLLTAGSPDSLVRIVFPNPYSDVYVAMVASVLVFILGFGVFFSRDLRAYRNLVHLNRDRIRKLRRQGQNNDQIADAILQAMGSFRGYRHNLARKKIMLALSEFN